MLIPVMVLMLVREKGQAQGADRRSAHPRVAAGIV
jgi:hypothetical protein